MTLLNIRLHNKRKEVSVVKGLDDSYRVSVAGRRFRVYPLQKEASTLTVSVNNQEKEVSLIENKGSSCKLLLEGHVCDVNFQEVSADQSREKEKSEERSILSPLPGTVLRIYAKAGEDVKKGKKILSIISMKMENDILASKDCMIKKIDVREKEMVKEGQLLVELG